MIPHELIEVEHRRLHLGDHLLDGHIVEIDREAYLDDEHRALHARRHHLESGQRCKENLCLHRVL